MKTDIEKRNFMEAIRHLLNMAYKCDYPIDAVYDKFKEILEDNGFKEEQECTKAV